VTALEKQRRAGLCIALATQLKRAALALGDAATLEAAQSALLMASKAKGRASAEERLATPMPTAPVAPAPMVAHSALPVRARTAPRPADPGKYRYTCAVNPAAFT